MFVTAQLLLALSLALPALLQGTLLPWIAQLSQPLARALLLQKLAEKSGLSPALLQSQLKLLKGEKREGEQNDASSFKALSSLQKELLGHLYYTAARGDPGPLLGALEEEELGEPWVQMYREWIEALNQGKAPHDQERSYWSSASHERVSAFLDDLDSQSGAFLSPGKGARTARLFFHLKRCKLQARRRFLQKELQNAGIEGRLFLLEQLASIEKEERALEEEEQRA